MNLLSKALIASLLFLSLTACDDGDDGDKSPTVDVTGRWSGTSVFLNQSSATTMTMTQDGANVTAVESDGTTWVGRVRGNVLELASSFSRNDDVGAVEMSGVVEANSMVLTGDFDATIEGVTLQGPVSYNLTRN